MAININHLSQLILNLTILVFNFGGYTYLKIHKIMLCEKYTTVIFTFVMQYSLFFSEY